MKRTIKFRGKDVFTETWRYGDLVHNQKVTTTRLEPRTMVGGYEVIPETVCQFTGCIDKNGKEIYEGDILRYNNSTFAVEWSENLGAFTLRPIREKGKCDDIPLGVILKYIRFIIIGNIHDKQEGGEDAGNNNNI